MVCLFCSLTRKAGLFTEKYEFPLEEVVAWAKQGETEGADALNLMSTGTYPFSRLLEIGRRLSRGVKVALVANTRDINHSEGGRWASMRIHLMRNDLGAMLDSSSKMSAEWAFLEMLHKEGRRVAESFLAQDGANLGKRSSIDLNVLLEGV